MGQILVLGTRSAKMIYTFLPSRCLESNKKDTRTTLTQCDKCLGRCTGDAELSAHLGFLKEMIPELNYKDTQELFTQMD